MRHLAGRRPPSHLTVWWRIKEEMYEKRDGRSWTVRPEGVNVLVMLIVAKAFSEYI